MNETPADFNDHRTAGRPYPADEMLVAEVGPTVNSPGNDGPECRDAA